MSDIEKNLAEPPKKGGKKMIFIIFALVLLLGLGAAYLFLFSNVGANLLSGDGPVSVGGPTVPTQDAREISEIEQRIMPMDEIIINIRDRQLQRLFKLNVSIELEAAGDRSAAEELKPILLDSFQSYLRSLRVSDIEGSRAIYQIKEELLSRAVVVLNPIRIKNILFSEMLIS